MREINQDYKSCTITVKLPVLLLIQLLTCLGILLHKQHGIYSPRTPALVLTTQQLLLRDNYPALESASREVNCSVTRLHRIIHQDTQRK